VRFPWLVVLLAACGRIGFGTSDSLDDGPPTGDGPLSPFATSEVTCQTSPTVLALPRDAQAGESLLVIFFMREPVGPAPTIAGGGIAWNTDVSFSTTTGSNQRHISIFHSTLQAPLVSSTQLAITHGTAESNGAAVFVIPTALARPTNEPAATSEGAGAFAGSLITAGAAALCVVVHHNTTGITYGPEWSRFYDLSSECAGGTRQSAGMHVALGAGGDVSCDGMLGSLSFTWAVAIVGFSDFPTP
jgi:hypothetical protein